MERILTDAWIRNDYVPGDGFLGYERIPFMSGLWNDNGTLKALAGTTTGTVGFKLVQGNNADLNKLVWEATADSTDKFEFDFTLPPVFRRDGGLPGQHVGLFVRAKVRKFDTTGLATDNSDLTLAMGMSWSNPAVTDAGVESNGSAYAALTADVTGKTLDGTALVPAKTATEGGERWMEWDFTNALSSAQKAALRAGASITFRMYPNEAIGTALQLEVSDIHVFYGQHLQPENKSLRNKALHA